MKFNKPQGDPVKTLLIILIGACLIVLVDLFVFGGKDDIWRKQKTLSPEEVSAIQDAHRDYMRNGVREPVTFVQAEAPHQPEGLTFSYKVHVLPDVPEREDEEDARVPLPSLREYIARDMALAAKEPEEDIQVRHQEMELDQIAPEIMEEPPAAYAYDEPKGKGLVVIMIDDMGLTARSNAVERLPGPLTLAYLPYADDLPAKTARAKANGHELMVHMPMEPINGNLDGGPAVLKVGQDRAAFINILKNDLNRFEGYVGVNNHMGSRLTQDKDAMRLVMAELKRRGVYFVDSKTIGTSVAADMAAESGLAYAERDVFLDHEITPEFVQAALTKLERTAYRKGYAIAIGHPHRVTIDALKGWLPTLKDKGLTLVPASAVVKRVKGPKVAANEKVEQGKGE